MSEEDHGPSPPAPSPPNLARVHDLCSSAYCLRMHHRHHPTLAQGNETARAHAHIDRDIGGVVVCGVWLYGICSFSLVPQVFNNMDDMEYFA